MIFFEALAQHAFLQNAFVAGLLASVACGVVGTYVVVKRIGYLAGGISHAVLGGMGVAYFFGVAPLNGALIAALIAAFIIGMVNLKARQHEDIIISALWSVGMALGIICISKTPGYNVDLMSYLFGNILMVSRHELNLMGALDIAILGFVGIFYKQLQAVCFDEEFSRLRGVKVEVVYLLLLALVACTIVVLIQVVGLILVIALLSLPAAIAGQYMRSLGSMMLVATVLGAVFTLGGISLSYTPNLPSGATIIMLAGLAYLISVCFKSALSLRR